MIEPKPARSRTGTTPASDPTHRRLRSNTITNTVIHTDPASLGDQLKLWHE